MNNKKVAFLTLGCKTNQYETNAMAQKFIEAGYGVCEMNENPDVAIINTCTVTNIADRKSRQTLRKVKQENKNAIVVAVGCYVQVAKDKLDTMKEVDLILGNSEKKDIIQHLEQYIQSKKDKEVNDIANKKEFEEFGCITYTEKTRATIKIQDGCNNFCTYCLIPYARGRIRSREKENIIEEVTKISKKGIKEIVLTGIHIASYGKDFNNGYMLIDLLEDLNKIDGIQRIRLGSLEPTIITEEFVERLKKLDKICNHYHLSLQSGCDETLKRMNRKYTTEEFRQVVNRLRENFENVNLTTDIIVGFPGETEEEFNKTYEFLKEIAFYKMHVFKYSKRDGTIASTMPNQVDGKVQEERSKKLIKLSDENQLACNKKYIGKELEVLFEEKQNNFYIGHTKNYVIVKLDSNKNLENKIITVIGQEISNEEIISKIFDK